MCVNYHPLNLTSRTRITTFLLENSLRILPVQANEAEKIRFKWRKAVREFSVTSIVLQVSNTVSSTMYWGDLSWCLQKQI